MAYSLYPHFTGDPYEKSFEFLDTVLLAAPEQTSFRYEDIIKQSDLPQIEKDIALHINSHFRNLIQRDLKYIEPLPNDIWKQRLTSLGRSVKKAGGHFAYLESLTNKATGDNERLERKDKSDKLDLTMKEWQVKTKRLPYILSALALVGTIISISIAFRALNKKQDQQDLQPMQQQIQALQDRVTLLDSLRLADTLQKKHSE